MVIHVLEEVLERRSILTAKSTGISRATYYRRRKMIELYRIQGFLDRSRRPHNVRKSSVSNETVARILKRLIEAGKNQEVPRCDEAMQTSQV